MDDIASNTNNTGPSNINSMGKHNLTVSWNIVVDATFRVSLTTSNSFSGVVDSVLKEL